MITLARASPNWQIDWGTNDLNGCGRLALICAAGSPRGTALADGRIGGEIPGRSGSPSWIVIHALLKGAMKQNPPVSVRRISTQLGYAGGNGGFIHRSFPDLCVSIAKKLEEWKERRTWELRLAVTAALLEQPPPTLHTLSQRLGFQTSTTLRYWVPDLADHLLKERADFAAREKAELYALVSRVLQENPPPSLKSIALRLQRSTSFLRENYPDLSRAVTARYLQHRQIRHMRR